MRRYRNLRRERARREASWILRQQLLDAVLMVRWDGDVGLGEFVTRMFLWVQVPQA